MRIPFVAGNWKMFKTIAEARQLVSELIPGIGQINDVEKVLCPPFTALQAVKALLEGTDIGLGAQNMYWEKSGAFTGEVSPEMVAELCNYVILGHSERRMLFGENDRTVNRKIKSAIQHGLVPIFCIGETLDENEKGLTAEIVSRQILKGLEGVSIVDTAKIVIAYEPVWAIGTGKAATAEGANSVVRDVIRPTLSELFGNQIAQDIRVLYGGSVKGSIAKGFFEMPEIDGALVGGASLNSIEFIQIVQSASK